LTNIERRLERYGSGPGAITIRSTPVLERPSRFESRCNPAKERAARRLQSLPRSRHDGTTEKLRIVIADDERPARSFLASILRTFKDVEIVGEAANGMEAVHLIESRHPDLALLDLQNA